MQNIMDEAKGIGCIMGCSNVGKTCLLQRKELGTFDEYELPT